jgi:hypothetical protein
MLVECLGWGLPAEALAGPTVERCGDRSELVGLPAGEVGALGEVLTQEPVGVLVRAALPWAVRVSEEHRDAGLDGERGVGGKFLAAVPRQRSAELLGQAAHRRRQRVLHRDRAVAGERGPFFTVCLCR